HTRLLQSFPTRRSSDLACAEQAAILAVRRLAVNVGLDLTNLCAIVVSRRHVRAVVFVRAVGVAEHGLGDHRPALRVTEDAGVLLDRKSTRLNSSHVKIS